jgi:hypothetical protein
MPAALQSATKASPGRSAPTAVINSGAQSATPADRGLRPLSPSFAPTLRATRVSRLAFGHVGLHVARLCRLTQHCNSDTSEARRRHTNAQGHIYSYTHSLTHPPTHRHSHAHTLSVCLPKQGSAPRQQAGRRPHLAHASAMLRATPPGRCVTSPGDDVCANRGVPLAGRLVMSTVAPPTTTACRRVGAAPEAAAAAAAACPHPQPPPPVTPVLLMVPTLLSISVRAQAFHTPLIPCQRCLPRLAPLLPWWRGRGWQSAARRAPRRPALPPRRY